MQKYVILQAYKRINIDNMKTKTKRQEIIRQIISEKEIRNQDELVKELRNVGIHVTQATLSRDIKQMKITL